jgi:uncharacterized protein (DUF433 family)
MTTGAAAARVATHRATCWSELRPYRRASTPTDQPLITIDPGRRGGRACVRDLRISVSDVLGWLAAGMSNSQLLDDHPGSKDDDFHRLVAARSDRPRLVHLAVGNASNANNDRIPGALPAAADAIESAYADDRVGIAIVGPPS